MGEEVQFMSLDDACLLRILEVLEPFPDRFHIAQTCKRLLHLSRDSRLHLRVSKFNQGSNWRVNSCRNVFPCLSEAIQSSRRGDTIVLESGVPHYACNTVVPWALKIKGEGCTADDSQLVCAKGTDTALDIRANCCLLNVSIASCVGACIIHRKGHLRIEQCKLYCDARGLDHLCSPIITLASTVKSQKRAMGTYHQLTGEGSVSVVDTQIEGGGKAVHCYGNGALESVRVMYCSNSLKFWFGINSRSSSPLTIRKLPPLKSGVKRKELCDAEEGCSEPKRRASV